MLRQLEQLSLDADGRYATSGELQFIKDYLESTDERLKLYKKMRDLEEKIIALVETRKKALVSEKLFQMGNKDVTWICRRDLQMVLRTASANMLIGDFDRLREGMLIWYETIVRAFGYKRYTQKTYSILQDVVEEHLTPSEAELIMPGLVLTHSLLNQ